MSAFQPQADMSSVLPYRNAARGLSIGCLFVLAIGCAPDRLSESQCRAVHAREMEYLQATSGTPLNPKWVEESAKRSLRACLSGKLYRTVDYECMKSAESGEDMSRCMAGAHEALRTPAGRDSP